MVTGNNLTFKDDTARRVTLCQLDCRHETPEDRDDFQHANIELYTLENRHRLAVAALTILRAFVVADRPYEGKRLGSYESWSDLICGAIVYAGMPNPLETVSLIRDQDNSGAIVRMLLDGIAEVGGTDGLTSQDILTGITSDETEWVTLQAAFAEITDKPTTRKIGNTLKGFQGRVCNGQRLISRPGRSNVKRWVVESLDSIIQKPDFPDVGLCVECGEPLMTSPTKDGYLNRRCENCNKDFRCIPDETASDSKLTQSAFV